MVAGAISGAAPVTRGAFDVHLSPRLRIASELQASGNKTPGQLRNDTQSSDRFASRLNAESGNGGLGAGGLGSGVLSSQTALSYDLSRFLTLRAANSSLDWSSAGENPLLGAPIFAGATRANGTGGGVDLNLGSALRFSTDVERLRADTGAGANRIGGAASISAWQDRFSLNMSLSRLLPQDNFALPATAAELGASLDVSQRLSLNLKYQGLFAPTPNTSASRVAGGVSLKF